jgi:D-alanyl-D-alanine carboxypeptidase/D-alanyl-D-alanine-endopeptidase (penicillin-binding protein 4)
MLTSPVPSRLFRLLSALTLLCGLIPKPARCQQFPTEQLQALLSSPELQHASVGVLVRRVGDGALLFALNPNALLVPASNVKLFTSAAALDAFGPDRRFATTVLANGRVRNRRLYGNLYLRGGGDPSLDGNGLAALAAKVRACGIRVVVGDLVVDEGLFAGPSLGAGWSWEDEAWYYAAPASALSLDGNAVQLTVAPGASQTQPPVVTLSAEQPICIASNHASTAPKGAPLTLQVEVEHHSHAVSLSGAIPIGAEPVVERLAVPRPAVFAAQTLRKALARRGIRVTGRIRQGRTPAAAHQLTALQSPPLRQLLAAMNKASDNLKAEVFLRLLGLADGQTRGGASAASGLRREMSFLNHIGIGEDELILVDGSGLSRLNLATPDAIVRLLVSMWSHRYGGVWRSSLPVAGVDGTLRRRMVGTPAQGRVFAKTGYLSHVSALSGYVERPDGEELAFSMLVNNFACPVARVKAIQDAVCGLLASYGQ